MTNKKRNLRLSIWAFLLALLLFLTATATLSIHATPATDFAKDKIHEAGNAVGDMARKAEDHVNDMTADNGTTDDTDGFIGNEQAEQTAPQPRETNPPSQSEANKSRVGQIALWVILAAVIIAVLMIIALIPKRKKD